MGCDIHIVVEIKIKNEWIDVYSTGISCGYVERNYEFFTELAGG